MCRKNSETPDDDGKLSSFILLTLYLFAANYLSFFFVYAVLTGSHWGAADGYET